MIIPIRCFTCGKVLADKWNEYEKLTKKDDNKKKEFTIDDITITEDDDPMKYFDNNPQKIALQKLGIQRMCCVRHFISQPNLINII
tara:strand:- start:1628 stop:1885 length:258 start_codon:yes stop_codon:yes gene_type:complete